MPIDNDDLLLLEASCKALDADPDAAMRVPMSLPYKRLQYVAVEKGVLRDLIQRFRDSTTNQTVSTPLTTVPPCNHWWHTAESMLASCPGCG